MERNYYQVLGIRSDASPVAVRAAFRQRARELHPDKSGLTGAPFIEAQEAYEILNDPDRRREYDRRLRRTRHHVQASFDQQHFDPADDLTLEVLLERHEARRGGRVRIEMPAQGAWFTEAAEQLVDIDFPAGIRDGYVLRLALTQFGIPNVYLTVEFRVGGTS